MKKVRMTGGAAALMAVLLCAPGIGAGASIKGKVTVTGALPALKKVDVTIDQYVCGTEKAPGDLLVSPQKELRNAVVWLENPPAGAAAPPQAKIEMDQNGCVFIPRVVIVPAGGTVDFLNSDRLLHNIHATPKLNVSFNRTQPKSRVIPGHLRQAGDRGDQLRSPLVDGGLGRRVGAPVLRDHRRRRAVFVRRSPAGPVQAPYLARAARHDAGERHRRRQAARARDRRDESPLTDRRGIRGPLRA